MKGKVLIVDDSESIRELISMSMIEQGFEITQAENGVEALQKSENEKFDLVITDVIMPKMDGITLLKEMRNQEKFKYTPILIITTEVQMNKKLEAKKLGATGWIVKPFDKEILKGVIKKILR